MSDSSSFFGENSSDTAASAAFWAPGIDAVEETGGQRVRLDQPPDGAVGALEPILDDDV